MLRDRRGCSLMNLPTGLRINGIIQAAASALARSRLSHGIRPVAAGGLMMAVGLFAWSGFPEAAAAPALTSILMASFAVGAMDAIVAHLARANAD